MHAMTEIRGGATGSARLLGGEVLDVTDPWCAAAPNFQLPDSTQLFVAVSLQGLGMTFESSLAWAGFVAQWDTICCRWRVAVGLSRDISRATWSRARTHESARRHSASSRTNGLEANGDCFYTL